jgi:hypothetical protein
MIKIGQVALCPRGMRFTLSQGVVGATAGKGAGDAVIAAGDSVLSGTAPGRGCRRRRRAAADAGNAAVAGRRGAGRAVPAGPGLPLNG